MSNWKIDSSSNGSVTITCDVERKGGSENWQ